VDLPNEAADRPFRRQRREHVVVIGHDDIPVEPDVPAVPVARVEVDEHLSGATGAKERPSLVGAAGQVVGAMW
jgi:hypothetical protein